MKQRLAELEATIKKYAHSTKFNHRLKMSEAATEKARLIASLPGSIRRGLARGNIVTA